MAPASLIPHMNALRRARGLMTLDEISALMAMGVEILDPFSVLISTHVTIGKGTVIYPAVTLLTGASGQLSLGADNLLHTGTIIAATAGTIRIGDGNQFGEGGASLKVNRPDGRITVGDGGRYLGGCQILGSADLGSGSQILGAISADDCRLEAGGTWRDSDPDRRGAVLKGAGVARGLTIPAGHVIAGAGTFHVEDMKPQSFYHPKG